MGGNRHFFIESKAFEFGVDHGGGAFIVRLYERGKDTLRSVFMGKASAVTLLAAMEELVSKNNTRNFVRTIREGETVFIIQRCSNKKGRYVMIQAIHRAGRRGQIIIPEGRNCNGWRGFAVELRSTIYPEVKPRHTTRDPLRKESSEKKGDGAAKSYAAVASGLGRNMGGGNSKGKEIISENIPDFAQQSMLNPKSNKLTLNIENGLYGRNKGEGDSVNLSLNIHLIRGSNGDWRVQHAAVGDSTTQDISKPGPSQNKMGLGSSGASTSYINPKPGPTTKPQMVWKPRTHLKTQNNIKPVIVSEIQTKTPVPSEQPKTLESAEVQTRIPESSEKVETQVREHAAKCLVTGSLNDGVHRTWGSSSDWVLQLRDGKRISIPLSLIRQPMMEEGRNSESSDEPKVLLLEGFADMGCSGDGESGISEDEDDDNTSIVWEDPEMAGDSGGAMVSCEDDEAPLEIEPLASIVPTGISEHLLNLGPTKEDRDMPNPSVWAEENYQAFGALLGASYEGYEDEIISLLKAIDARRSQQTRDNGKIAKSGGKGSRELKSLISTVNYETGSSRRRGDPRDRVLSVVQ